MSHGGGWRLRRTEEHLPLLKAVLLVPQTNLHQPCSPALGLPSPGPGAPLGEAGWLRAAGAQSPHSRSGGRGSWLQHSC